eukprot:scaffold22634_cov123-Cylindrotheca_fusiformis.AAC.7
MLEEISEDDSKKLAKELTEKYPSTVYGMANGLGLKITSLKVKKVTNKGCGISLVTCKGDVCEMKQEHYDFHPPLQSASEVFSKRIPRIRDEVLAPKVQWLVTEPLALLILVLVFLTAYGTFILGMDGIVDGLAQAPNLENGVTTVFGSANAFSIAVVGAFWFAFIAHALESLVVIWHSVQTLHLGIVPTSLWAILVLLVGYPIFSKFLTLASVQTQYTKKSK